MSVTVVTPGTGVTPEDIASVQEAQEEMMPEYVHLYPPTKVRDGLGGTKTTYDVERSPGSPIIGRAGSADDKVREQFADQLRGKSGATLTVPVNSPVAEGDEVVIDSPYSPRLSGRYRVVADLSRSSYVTAFRFLIVEV